MRRIVMAVVFAAGLLVLVAQTGISASASITPNSQSHAHGVASSWTGSWSGSSPFDIYFFYGDGVTNTLLNTTSTSKHYSHAFWPCTTTQFTQELDNYVHNGVIQAAATSHATENGGNPC